MAKLNDKLVEQILSDHHTGYFSVRQLADKYDIGKTTIAKIVKDIPPKHKSKVDTLISIKSALSKENGQEVDSVNKIVDEKTKHLLFFNNSALRNQQIANKKLTDELELSELEMHSRITARNKDTVIGKEIKIDPLPTGGGTKYVGFVTMSEERKKEIMAQNGRN